jgi:hypothetical protein
MLPLVLVGATWATATLAADPAPRLHSTELLQLVDALRAGDTSKLNAVAKGFFDYSEPADGGPKVLRPITAGALASLTKGCDLHGLTYDEQVTKAGKRLEGYRLALACSYYNADTNLSVAEFHPLAIIWHEGKFLVESHGRRARPPLVRLAPKSQ